MKASIRSDSQITPAGRPMTTPRRSRGPALPSARTWSPWSKWCGPQVKAMAIQAAPKCEKPNDRQSFFISRAVMMP